MSLEWCVSFYATSVAIYNTAKSYTLLLLVNIASFTATLHYYAQVRKESYYAQIYASIMCQPQDHTRERELLTSKILSHSAIDQPSSSVTDSMIE